MHVPVWIDGTFDMKIDNKGYESVLEDELIEMHVSLDVKALFRGEALREYIYPKLDVKALFRGEALREYMYPKLDVKALFRGEALR